VDSIKGVIYTIAVQTRENFPSIFIHVHRESQIAISENHSQIRLPVRPRCTSPSPFPFPAAVVPAPTLKACSLIHYSTIPAQSMPSSTLCYSSDAFGRLPHSIASTYPRSPAALVPIALLDRRSQYDTPQYSWCVSCMSSLALGLLRSKSVHPARRRTDLDTLSEGWRLRAAQWDSKLLIAR
jgi:hypothetical protein